MKPGEPIFDFYGDLMEIALSHLKVPLGGEEIYPWVERLFAEYSRAGKDERMNWLRRRLPEEFKCVCGMPTWLEEDAEPWPFYRDEPMVFIGQLSLPESEVTRRYLSWDECVYLFGAREPRGDGFELVFREIVQSR